jgi:hypothetical protein
MGLFSRKKDDQMSSVKMRRKEVKSQLERENASQERKDILIERLNELRKRMYYNPNFDHYSIRLDDSISMLKCMPDCSDLDAVASIDSLLLAEIDDAILYCGIGDYEYIGISIDNIERYIKDRRLGYAYYKDEKYCKCIIERNRLYKYIIIKNHKRNTLERMREEICNAVNAPNGKVNGKINDKQVDTIDKNLNLLDESIECYQSRLNLINKALHAIMIHENDSKIIDIDDVLSKG